jgi:hypothetical protein
MSELMSEGGIRLILQDPRMSEDQKIDLLVAELEKYKTFQEWMMWELGRRVYEREQAKLKKES